MYVLVPTLAKIFETSTHPHGHDASMIACAVSIFDQLGQYYSGLRGYGEKNLLIITYLGMQYMNGDNDRVQGSLPA